MSGGRLWGLLTLTLLMLGMSALPRSELSHQTVWVLGAFITIYTLITLTLVQGLWSMATIYAVMLSLFHVGLAIYPLLGREPVVYEAPLGWFYTTQAATAVWISSLAIAAFGVGALLTGRRRLTEARSRSQSWAFDLDRVLSRVGPLLVIGSVSAWVAIMFLGLGPQFFLSSYSAYKVATGDYPVAHAGFFLSLGMAMIAASHHKRSRRLALIVFGAFALLALPLGLRGEIMFPAAAYLVVRARHRSMPSLKVAVVGALVALCAIGIIKDLRSTGLAEADSSVIVFAPLAGLGELGYSVRTVQAVVTWHEGGVQPRYGATYWAPVQRGLGRIVSGKSSSVATDDSRLMNIEMRNREGNIGGSVIAEAFRNFEAWGALFVLLFLGLVAGRFDRAPPMVSTDMLLGVVLTAMLQHVRNSFTPIPFQLVVGLSAILCVVMLSIVTSRRRGDTEHLGHQSGFDPARAGVDRVPGGRGL